MIDTTRSIHASVATITMRRSERRNALDAGLVDALTGAFQDLSSDPTIRVIVLTGEGPAFSAGADLAALERLQTATLEQNRADSARLATLFRTIIEAPVPVLARVNGHAIAGGAGLVAACDAAVSVDSASFGFTEVKIGFVPAIVSSFLVRRISGAPLRELLLSGRLIGAHEARQIGLVSRVVPAERLDEEVAELAVAIARDTSREAVAATKRLLAQVPDLEWPAALELGVETNAIARGTPDCRAGVRAFLAREDPPWKKHFDG